MKKLVIFSLIIVVIVVFYLIPVKIQTFEQVYSKNDEISESLKKFRTIALKSIIVNNTEWKYLSIGTGKKTILFLHGMSGSYDVWWQQINYFKSDYRIISLTYPPVKDLKSMGNAILKILDKEKIEKTIIVGSSLGGYFSQYLAYNYPERIEKAVFANTFPVNKQIEEDNKYKTVVLKIAPEWLVMAVMRKGLYKKILPAGNNSRILEAFMIEQFSGYMSKKQFVARYECVIDKFEQTKKLSIPILIIESDNDPLVKKELREKLKTIYPNAKIVTLHNMGHFPYLNEANNYNNILKSFFEH